MSFDLENQNGASILVVDDVPANLNVLTGLLQGCGYSVRPVPSGELALLAACSQTPDLVLLDVHMPGMDGYEVCERLQNNKALSRVPVIFISAYSESIDKLRGFKLGAVDFVTKPFDFEEVAARVKTHLELARLRRELEQHNASLKGALEESYHHLEKAHARLSILDKAKSDFLVLISHEIRTPLGGLLGAAELVLQTCGDSPLKDDCETIYRSCRTRLMGLIEDALLLTQIDIQQRSSDRELTHFDEAITSACCKVQALAAEKRVFIGVPPSGLGLVHAAPSYLFRALQSLIETAVKFARPGAVIRLLQEEIPGQIGLIIEADGTPVPTEILPRFFDLLSIADSVAPGGDLGLAPAVAERIVTLFGGSVTVENMGSSGMRFKLRLNPGRMETAAEKNL